MAAENACFPASGPERRRRSPTACCRPRCADEVARRLSARPSATSSAKGCRASGQQRDDERRRRRERARSRGAQGRAVPVAARARRSRAARSGSSNRTRAADVIDVLERVAVARAAPGRGHAVPPQPGDPRRSMGAARRRHAQRRHQRARRGARRSAAPAHGSTPATSPRASARGHPQYVGVPPRSIG